MAEGDRENRVALLAIVGVVLLAVLTVCVVVLSRESGEGVDEAAEPADGDQRASESPEPLPEVWQTPDIARSLLDDATLWPGDAELTRVTPGGGVEAFDTLDGTPVWSAQAPARAVAEGAQARVCAASEATNADGVGAVLYEAADGGGCAVLAVVEPGRERGGEPLWSVDLSDDVAGPFEASGTRVTVGEATVTVSLDAAGSLAGFHRFDLASGAELPLPEPPADGERDCVWQPLGAWHAGSRFATLSTCGGAAALSVYDADSAALKWTHLADEGLGVSGMLAGDPVLVFQDDALVAYSETGDELWRRPVGEGPGEVAAGTASVVVGGALLTPDPAGGDGAFAAYGLTDGQELWRASLPAGTQLFGVDSNGLPLLGHVVGGDDRLRLLWLDPEDGSRIPAGSVALSALRTGDEALVAADAHQLYVMTQLDGAAEPRLRLRAFER